MSLFRPFVNGSLTAILAALVSACGGDKSVAPVVLSVTKVTDLPATMPAGASDSVRTRVVNNSGRPVEGIVVSFTITGASSTLSSVTATTDTGGRAAVGITIAGLAGQTTTVTASIDEPSSVTFSTTIVPGAPSRMRLTSPRVIVLDQGASTQITAAFTDEFGNEPTSPPAIALQVREPIANDAGSTLTAVSPGQTIVVARLASNGLVRDSVLLVVVPATGVAAHTDLSRFDLKADTTFTVPVFMDMRSSGEKLGSTRVQIFWDASALTYVSDAEGANNVGATVNPSTPGTVTLAVANAAGFAGKVELRRITFRAAATTGRTTSLRLVVTELNGVSPNFTDLKPKTIAVSHPLITR